MPEQVPEFLLIDEQVKVDLHVFALEGPASLTLQLLGTADLFEQTSVDRMTADFHEILQQMVADPGQTIDRLLPEPRHRGVG